MAFPRFQNAVFYCREQKTFTRFTFYPNIGAEGTRTAGRRIFTLASHWHASGAKRSNAFRRKILFTEKRRFPNFRNSAATRTFRPGFPRCLTPYQYTAIQQCVVRSDSKTFHVEHTMAYEGDRLGAGLFEFQNDHRCIYGNLFFSFRFMIPESCNNIHDYRVGGANHLSSVAGINRRRRKLFPGVRIRLGPQHGRTEKFNGALFFPGRARFGFTFFFWPNTFLNRLRGIRIVIGVRRKTKITAQRPAPLT